MKLSVDLVDVLSALADSEQAIFQLAEDGTVVAWTASAERVYGYTAQEMIGRPPTRFVPRELISTERRWLGCVITEGRVLHVETKRWTKSGAILVVSLNLIPLRDETGTVVRAAAFEREMARNVTLEADRASPPIAQQSQAIESPTSYQARVRTPAPTRETILVVDDDPSIREYICRVLKGHGYVTFAAADGQEALKVVEAIKSTLHLVVSDIVMPEIDGRALFAQIRTWYPNVAFVFMSGSEPAIVTDPFDGSPTQFLAKPFGLARLLAEVRQALDRGVSA